MQFQAKKLVILFYTVLIIFLTECTQNPFDSSEKVTPQGNKIEGNIELSDRLSPEGVYVWLERLDLGTWTDKNGFFEMIIPSAANQMGGGISGNLNLYFYSANYQLETTSIVFVNGRALHSHGALNKDCALKNPVNLTKILEVKTEITPNEFPQNPTLDPSTNISNELINVQLTLRSFSGTVNIKCSNDELGPLAVLFIKSADPGKEYVEMLKVKGPTATIITSNQPIGPTPKIWSASFTLDVGHLARGDYEIIPYFFPLQESVPDDLLESLGKNVTLPIQNYLNLPMKRKGGEFKVIQ